MVSSQVKRMIEVQREWQDCDGEVQVGAILLLLVLLASLSRILLDAGGLVTSHLPIRVAARRVDQS